MSTLRGRFAPSPTGYMHLGNARSALLGYLHARSLGGQFLLRIEDLDKARCRPAYVDALLRDLDYLGIEWDEPPVFQSQRQEAYAAALANLERSGRIYPCFCSRQEVLRAASAPHGPSDDGPRYPGTCRNPLSPNARPKAASSAAPGLGGSPLRPKGDDPLPGDGRARAPSLRFISQPGETSFDDEIHGRQGHDVVQTVGDFVVRRGDGVASYQLAVVVDDAASGITHVLRGDDLLPSTPRQLQLYSALGLTPPRFAHVPLLHGEDGKRLAKREGAFAIRELRQRGVPSDRVLGLLAKWSGLGDGTPISTRALIPRFSLALLSPTPTVVRESELSSLLE